MREYTIRKGNHKGKHQVYDSVQEANEYGIKDIKDPWWNMDVAAGDWVKSDDGYVVQCLNRDRTVNKRHRSGQFTDLFMFPQGIFYVYYDKKGNPNIKNFYAAYTRHKKGSIGDGPITGRYMNPRKKLFIEYIKKGVDPVASYMIAFNKNTAPLFMCIKKTNELLSEPQILEELMEAIKPFIQDIEDRVKEISSYDSLYQLHVDRTAKLLVAPTKNTIAEIALLTFSLKLLGKQMKIIEPDTANSKYRDIKEAAFTEVPPLQINAN